MKKQIEEDTEYGESLPPPLCLESATDPVVRHGMANASSTVPGLLGLRTRNLDPQHTVLIYTDVTNNPSLPLKLGRNPGWLTSHFLRHVICRLQVAHILAVSELNELITCRLR